MVCRKRFGKIARMDGPPGSCGSNCRTPAGGANPMRCLVCESDNSRLVWQQDGSRIERCGGCGVLFVANPPSQAELNALYNKGVLTGAPLENLGHDDGPPPEWKQHEQMSILEQLQELCGSGGALLDVGAFSGMFLQNAKRAGFDVVGVEPIREAYLHISE